MTRYWILDTGYLILDSRFRILDSGYSVIQHLSSSIQHPASSISTLVLALAAGVGLGIFYFGGLWLTVRRFLQARRSVLLVIGSFFGRNAVCLLVFYLIARGGHWGRLLLCVLGFFVTRTILVRRWGTEKRAHSLLQSLVLRLPPRNAGGRTSDGDEA